MSKSALKPATQESVWLSVQVCVDLPLWVLVHLSPLLLVRVRTVCWKSEEKKREASEEEDGVFILEAVARWSRDDALKLGCECSWNSLSHKKVFFFPYLHQNLQTARRGKNLHVYSMYLYRSIQHTCAHGIQTALRRWKQQGASTLQHRFEKVKKITSRWLKIQINTIKRENAKRELHRYCFWVIEILSEILVNV